MFPFDLPGPQFLLFYLVFAALVLIVLRSQHRHREGGDTVPPTRLDDPYLIACLRGGPVETIRVAAVALADRGLLVWDPPVFKLRDDQVWGDAKVPLERAVLEAAREPITPTALLADANALTVCESYQQTLALHRLIPDQGQIAARRASKRLGLALLLGVAGLKIALALATGHSNVLFLIILAAIGGFLVNGIFSGPRTLLGDRTLTDLAQLFAGLRKPPAPPAEADQAVPTSRFGLGEAALLAAVFGVTALSVAEFPFARELRPAGSESSGDGSGGSDSGGSDSGGDSGGGGCGGCGGGGGDS